MHRLLAGNDTVSISK